jgi:hypothetical protein
MVGAALHGQTKYTFSNGWPLFNRNSSVHAGLIDSSFDNYFRGKTNGVKVEEENRTAAPKATPSHHQRQSARKPDRCHVSASSRNIRTLIDYHWCHQFSANLRLLKSVQNRSRLKLLLRKLISPHVASFVLSTVVRPTVYRRPTPSPMGL